MDSNRKLLILLAVIGVVILVVYGAGLIGARSGGSGGSSSWQSRFGAGIGSGQLTTADLVPSESGCQVKGSSIQVTNRCVLSVVPVSSRFHRVTRRGVLTTQTPVSLLMTVSGQTLTKDVDPGTPVTVTFGRDGGLLQVSCSVPVLPCTVILTAPSSEENA